MLFNHLKIAWRSLRKNKIYAAVNVVGLAVGIAAALLIFRMVSYELSFNKNFANYNRITRVVAIDKTPEEGEVYTVCTPIPAMDAMESTVSQFEAMARVREVWSSVTIPNPAGGPPLKKFGISSPELGFFADPAFFKVFDLNWLAGDPATALAEPNTIVLNRTWAEKCFDNWEKAVGQTVLVDNIVPVTVKGVVADLPENCDFPLMYFISYPTLKANAALFFYQSEWGSCSSNNQVYALLSDPGQMDAANAVLAKVGEKEYSNRTGQQTRHHILQPLSDLHYNENLGHSGSHIITKSRLKVLGSIGVLILIMACFNFINLATAQSSLRAKEVGVRKTLGGRQGQLISQFMSETGLIVGISVLLGAGIAYFSAPLLKRVSDVPDQLPFLSNPMVWGFLGLTAVLVTLLAGLYPSISLAGYEPVKAIRKNVTQGRAGGAALRKSLVVLQFMIAQGLIIGAMITILQLDYIRSRDLGFNKELVYTFSFNSDSASIARQEALKQRLLQIPAVELVSLNSDQPFSGNTWSSNFRYGTHPEDEPFNIDLKFCDADYQKTYGIKLLAGKWMAPSDTMREAVVNMTLLRKLGIADPEEVVGQNIRLGGRRMLRISGVAEDFHTHSLRQEHEPLLMSTRKEFYWEAGIKIRPDNITSTTAAIKSAFDEVLPEQIFSGRFLDERIARFYQDDNRLSATCRGFGFLAILISCLGLFGLATHAAEQRVKEIGIRKVLGATVSGILALLSRDFLKLVMIALVLATPIAWYAMNTWLNNFVYHISIGWWVFVFAGLMAVLVAFLTVSYQAVRAALANPIKSLRSE